MWDLEISLLAEDGYVQEKGKINKTIKFFIFDIF